MKRAKRNRLIRIAASTMLAFSFVLWVASLTTSIARFDIQSEFTLANGKLVLISTDLPIFDANGINAHSEFVGAKIKLLDQKDITGCYISCKYYSALKPPHWDAEIAQLSFIRQSDFWQTREYGWGWPRFNKDVQTHRVNRKWRTINLERLEIPLGTTLLIVSAGVGICYWRTRSYPSGHCQQCNYDLYSNTTNTCPECGTAAPIMPLPTTASSN